MLNFSFELNWNYKGKRGREVLFHTALGNFQAAMRDWSPAFRNMVSDVLEPAVDDQFKNEGNADSSWAELAPSTLKQKERKGFSGGILTATGALRSSFHQGDPNNFTEITRNRLRWGSMLKRSLFHQTGTRSRFQKTESVEESPGMRGVPMRKEIVLSEADKKRMRSIMVRQLAQIARREGFSILGSDQTPLDARRAGEIALGL